MSPTVPFHFDPPASDYETEHLIYQDLPGGQQVTWPLVRASLFVPISARGYWLLDDIVDSNGDAFFVHRNKGFSIGKYHEFFVEPLPVGDIGFKMGNIETTFGYATPLAAFLFDGIRTKWNGSWEDISTVRILGAHREEVEIALLNACMQLESQTGYWPRTIDLGEPNWSEDELEQAEEKITTGPPMFTDIEPLRFLRSGALQADNAAACVFYYRVIEYFAFFVQVRDIGQQRNDSSISNSEFAKRVIETVSRDERGAIVRIVKGVADKPCLEDARSYDLISSASPEKLGQELYNFRNSIVHGKFGSGFDLKSSSALIDDPIVAKWRDIMQRLARRAIDLHGTTAS